MVDEVVAIGQLPALFDWAGRNDVGIAAYKRTGLISRKYVQSASIPRVTKRDERWVRPEAIQQLIIDVYDPADSRQKRINAIRITISREVTQQFNTENLTNEGIEDLMLEVAQSAQHIEANGTVTDLKVDAALRRDEKGE